MIQYIMFNGNKYVPESKISAKERGHALRIVGSADGLHFCITGANTRYYMVDESKALASMLLS
jgi:hypothetical protein